MIPRLGILVPCTALLSIQFGSGCAGTQKKSEDQKTELRSESRCDRAGKRVEEVDLNGDGKADVWKIYATTVESGTQVSVLVCKEVDLNMDGRKDMWVHYLPNGNKDIEEFDLDFDSKIDMRVVYQNGRRVREEVDTNFDGKPDLFKYYEGERLSRIERSSKGDSKIDVWEYYEGGRLDRIGYDTTGAGQPDRWDRSPDDSVPAETVPQAPSAPQAAPSAPPRLESPPPKDDVTAQPADREAPKAPRSIDQGEPQAGHRSDKKKAPQKAQKKGENK